MLYQRTSTSTSGDSKPTGAALRQSSQNPAQPVPGRYATPLPHSYQTPARPQWDRSWGCCPRLVPGLKQKPRFDERLHLVLDGAIYSALIEVKTDEALLAHIKELNACIDRKGVLNYDKANGGEQMWIQVAYTMLATFCRHAVLFSTSYGYICRLTGDGTVLEVEGPFHLRQPSDDGRQKLDGQLGRAAPVLSYRDQFMYFYRASQHTVKLLLEQTAAKQPQETSLASRIPVLRDLSVPSIIPCWSGLADEPSRWLASVAFRSCHAIMVHNARGEPPTRMERTAPSLVAPGRFDWLIALLCPRTLHIYPIATAGEGLTSHVMRVRFCGLLSCVLKSQRQQPEEDQRGVTLEEEYNLVRQVKKRDPVRFAALPIPQYHGLFSVVSDGAGHSPGEEEFQGMTDFLAMSDNGHPVTDLDTKHLLTDECERALALVRLSGFRANDHNNFWNTLYDGKSLTIIDFV